MRIAVLSDTHNRLPDAVSEAIRAADEIWHLGDICDERIATQLGKIAPLRLVRGNCDDIPDWPYDLAFKLHGHRFHLRHIPTDDPPPCDFFLHGHTHIPRDETIRGVRFLNPGCISRPKGLPPGFAWFTVSPREVLWKTVPLDSLPGFF